MPPIKPRQNFGDAFAADHYLESDRDYVMNNINAAVWLLDLMQRPMMREEPAPYEELDAHQWGGLARDLVMCLDMNCRRGDEIHAHLTRIGTPIPEWLATYIPDAPFCTSKGDVVCAIVRAALTAEPS